jgi:hypothetical protein
VRGPVLPPPCIRQRRLPLMAGLTRTAGSPRARRSVVLSTGLRVGCYSSTSFDSANSQRLLLSRSSSVASGVSICAYFRQVPPLVFAFSRGRNPHHFNMGLRDV